MLIVQKFGGTSVANPERLRHVADLVAQTRAQGHRLVVVLSAMAGETNRLLALGKEMASDPDAAEPDPAELDQLIATGEQVTVALLALALKGRGIPALSLQGWQAGIHTEAVPGKARIRHIDTTAIRRALDEGSVVVVAGFQGVDDAGRVTTLGRGGSDTTAVALAAALQADECQIFTDVDGVYTTDPRLEPAAQRLAEIPVDAMLEMASLGSKVLQTRSVEFAGKYGVPLRVLSSFAPDAGTLVTPARAMENALVSGVAASGREQLLRIRDLPDTPATLAGLFMRLSAAHIETDLLSQSHAGQGRTHLSFSVADADRERAETLLADVVLAQGGQLLPAASVAKVSVVGVALRSHPALAGQVFDALAAAEVEMLGMAMGETRLTVLVVTEKLQAAVQALHQRLFPSA